MRNFLLLLTLFVFVSCSGDAVKRLTPVADEPSEAGEDLSDGETPDSGVVSPDENGDPAEMQDEERPVPDGDTPETTDAEEVPDGDTPETPDEYEDGEPEIEDIEYPECGIAFDGSNCSASYCKTVDDCCEGDVCVSADACGGWKVCRNAFFKENFDSYVAGSFPKTNWTLKYNGIGTNYQIVTSEKYVSEQNSMHLLGSKTYNNSAVMTTVLPQVPNVINVEMKMNTEGDDVSFSLCTFEHEASGSNWGNYDMKVEFADGLIRYQIPEWYAYEIAPSYETNKWYKIRLKLDQVNKTVSIWVDDELKVDKQVHNFGTLSIPNLCLVADKKQKKVWFDDIFVWGE